MNAEGCIQVSPCVAVAMEPRSDERGRLDLEVQHFDLAGASMEPRSDERGRQKAVVSLAAAVSLQWSRVRMNAEGPRRSPTSRTSTSLQWSRVRMNAEGWREDGKQKFTV